MHRYTGTQIHKYLYLVWKKQCESAYCYLEDPPKLVAPVGIPDWEGEPGRNPENSNSRNHNFYYLLTKELDFCQKIKFSDTFVLAT